MVPIVYDGRRFGVLTVYPDRTDVFDPRECAVLSDPDGALGHAPNALERKAAPMGDTVLEVESRTSDYDPTLVEVADSPTVHKHLRHAHRRILDSLLTRPALSTDGG